MPAPTATAATTRTGAAEARSGPGPQRSTRAVGRAAARTVADAMITEVKLGGSGTTVRELRTLFRDDHVHAAVIVEDGVLLAVVDRADLDATAHDDEAALHLGGRLARTIAPEVDLEQARRRMVTAARRRLAVVTADGRFLGLLCLKRTGRGFCSDLDVRARADELRRGSGPSGATWLAGGMTRQRSDGVEGLSSLRDLPLQPT